MTGWPLFIGVTRLDELAGPETDWLLADFQVAEEKSAELPNRMILAK